MPFDNVALLRFFVDVVEAGSLSAAARAHHISLPAASRKLRQLESTLGVRLLYRTTRRQSLTEEGQTLYEQALRILDDLNQMEQTLSHNRQHISGLLRLTTPISLGRRKIAPLLAAFAAQHPKLKVQLELTDTVLDLVASGLDLVVRIGALHDSSYISRPLASNYRVLCASPAYLHRHGTPHTPAELTCHRCLHIGTQVQADWRVGDVSVRIHPHLISNDGEVVHQWALDGHGIALKSIWDVAEDIRAGRLHQVLPQYQMPTAPLHAVYPHKQHVAPRVRAVIDFLAEHLRQPGLEQGGGGVLDKTNRRSNSKPALSPDVP